MDNIVLLDILKVNQILIRNNNLLNKNEDCLIQVDSMYLINKLLHSHYQTNRRNPLGIFDKLMS